MVAESTKSRLNFFTMHALNYLAKYWAHFK